MSRGLGRLERSVLNVMKEQTEKGMWVVDTNFINMKLGVKKPERVSINGDRQYPAGKLEAYHCGRQAIARALRSLNAKQMIQKFPSQEDEDHRLNNWML